VACREEVAAPGALPLISERCRVRAEPGGSVQGIAHWPYPASVTVPDFQSVMRPILVALGDGEPRPVQTIRSMVAEALGVSEEDQEELLASGKQTRYPTGLGGR
jgi:hypothetical protein